MLLNAYDSWAQSLTPSAVQSQSRLSYQALNSIATMRVQIFDALKGIRVLSPYFTTLSLVGHGRIIRSTPTRLPHANCNTHLRYLALAVAAISQYPHIAALVYQSNTKFTPFIPPGQAEMSTSSSSAAFNPPMSKSNSVQVVWKDQSYSIQPTRAVIFRFSRLARSLLPFNFIAYNAAVSTPSFRGGTEIQLQMNTPLSELVGKCIHYIFYSLITLSIKYRSM